MGLYTSALIYHGRLLTQESYNKIKDVVPENYITKLNENRYILSSPNGIVSCDGYYKILDKCGHLKDSYNLNELMEYVDTDKKELFLSEINNEEMNNKLLEFISLIDKEKAFINTYLIQFNWSTYDADPHNNVTHNIKLHYSSP